MGRVVITHAAPVAPDHKEHPMTANATPQGYRIDLDPAEREQLLIALEIAVACRRGEDGRGALIRLVDTAAVAALADRLTPAECAPATRPIRGDEAARWRVTDTGRAALPRTA